MISDILSNHSSTQECLSPIKLQSYPENIAEFTTLQTESQIEIIYNNNKGQKRLDQTLSSSIHTQQISTSHEIISSNEIFASSTAQHEQSSLPIFQYERIVSSTSQCRQASSSISEDERISSLTFPHAQVPSPLFEDEDLSSIYEDEHILSTTSQCEQVSLSTSKKTSSSNYRN